MSTNNKEQQNAAAEYKTSNPESSVPEKLINDFFFEVDANFGEG
jgi:hypothetical protein